MQSLERELSNGSRPLVRCGFGVAAEFRRVPGRAQMNDLLVSERDAQTVGAIEVSNSATQFSEQSFNRGAVAGFDARIEPGQNLCALFGRESLRCRLDRLTNFG